MAQSNQLNKRSASNNNDDFVFMGKTRALLTEVIDHWQTNLGHTPEVARRMLDAAMEEFHRSELSPEIKSAKSQVKRIAKMARKDVKAAGKKVKAVKKTLIKKSVAKLTKR